LEKNIKYILTFPTLPTLIWLKTADLFRGWTINPALPSVRNKDRYFRQVPIDHSPQLVQALDTIQNFIAPMNEEGAAIELMHVGGIAPLVRRMSDGAIVPVALRTGDVMSTILQAAEEQQADLIAMPTAGHQGFLDVLRGSTTERVLRHAPCPVLAVPAG
jgi:hypothetical protein